MKKNKFLIALALFSVMLACEDEGSPKGTGIDFETLASTYNEIDGTGSVVLPLRNGTVSESQISFSGTAIEGVDYELVGVTDEGIEISIIDDDSLEAVEFIKVIIESSGNNVHTINVNSNCEDVLGLEASFFEADYDATEFYCGLDVTTGSCDYGPYTVHLVQDDTDPNKFHLDDFYDSGYDVYMVFDIAAGTVSFPNQDAVGDGSSPAITASTGTFTLCGDAPTLVINLNYDGGDWVYKFVKH